MMSYDGPIDNSDLKDLLEKAKDAAGWEAYVKRQRRQDYLKAAVCIGFSVIAIVVGYHFDLVG